MLPGISPGKTALGKASFCAFAPSRTGGSFTKFSSSLGNLKPFFLKASPKSFNSGKLLWQVVHEVWYFREKAGIAEALGVDPRIHRSKPIRLVAKSRAKFWRFISMHLLVWSVWPANN